MAATAAQIAQVRRMVAEPTTTTYSDFQIAAFIERYPILDANGEHPLSWNMAVDPPTQSANSRWVPSYNLNVAAADIWEEKAAAVAAQFDFSADRSSFTQSQLIKNALSMRDLYLNKKIPVARPLP